MTLFSKINRENKMIVAIDVHYKADYAKAVSITFEDWEDEKPLKTDIAIIKEVAPYVPGQFYKRELPCILEVLKYSEGVKIDAIIVDGYVLLDDYDKLGLGGFLYDALSKRIPVIGVAKTHFYSARNVIQEVLRGETIRPLYVTSLGVDPKIAAANIQRMKGDYRMPDLLRLLDQETKRV